jgi:glycosyltransferase involved in cell wall biosynthesis
VRKPYEQLRVAIVSDAAPERNGVGTYHCDLAAHLRPVIGRVELMSPGYGAEPLPQWLSVPLPGDATQRIGVPSPLELKRRLNALRPHTVVVATPGVHGFLGARYAAGLGARLVYVMHTHYENLTRLYWRGLMRPVNQAYLRKANRHLLQRADRVAAVAEEMRLLAEADGARGACLVGTLLPARFLETPLADRGDELGRVLFLGRLAAEKRVETVLEAAEALPERQFVIAGEGPLRPRVEETAARLPNVEYLGWIDRDGVLALLDRSDMLVLPSQVEAFGTVALEALARGVLTLVSPGSGIRDWPDLGRALFTIGDGESVTEAIARVSAVDPVLRRRKVDMGVQATRTMVRQTLDQWLALLDTGLPAVGKSGL